MSVIFNNQIGIGSFSSDTLSLHQHFMFNVAAGDQTVNTSVVEDATDGSATNAYSSELFQVPIVFADGSGADAWSFTITKEFFAAHVGTTISYAVTFTGSPSGQTDSAILAFDLVPFDPHILANEFQAIMRFPYETDIAAANARQIDHSTLTEASFVSGLLNEAANFTIPAVAVEGSMYDHVGSSKEIDNLVNNFLPAQVATALQFGLNPQVYACEVLGLAFAASDENGGTGFATLYGPGNASMQNTVDGDAAFAAAATIKIFGAAAGPQTPGAIAGFVANWKAFYTDNGIPGILNPTPDQVDLFARGAAWGDAVGVALDGKLGQLPVLTTNFLEDAAQGSAIYSASLAAQPTPTPFEGATSSASAAGQMQLVGIPADVQHIGM